MIEVNQARSKVIFFTAISVLFHMAENPWLADPMVTSKS